ncbi:MAG: ferredoxin, partial [Rikenellaceae bacterium]|nr:ferredoxin [Rikenellaceae bacterium]
LTNSHRFLTVEHLKAIERGSPEEHPLADDYRRLCSAYIPMDPVEPRSLVKYDNDIKLALGKMEKARELCRQLPGIDCGACGAPSCKALAEDVVCRDVPLGTCIFMQAKLEKSGEISPADGRGLMESVWGKQLFRDKKP